MKLIVGLGNPGARYAETRHNVGWRVAEELAHRAQAEPSWKEKFEALVAETRRGSEKVVLARPVTFMNLSGLAVRHLVDFWKVANEDLLVVSDDLALELGRIRVRASGSGGGHNGLESVIVHLGSEAFPRLRVGIGPGPVAEEQADFVLAPFAEAEQPVIAEAITRAADAAECWTTEGLEAAMNRFNPAGPTPETGGG
jgi:PTH1 family peptidyl-tRNA hydrolase